MCTHSIFLSSTDTRKQSTSKRVEQKARRESDKLCGGGAGRKFQNNTTLQRNVLDFRLDKAKSSNPDALKKKISFID